MTFWVRGRVGERGEGEGEGAGEGREGRVKEVGRVLGWVFSLSSVLLLSLLFSVVVGFVVVCRLDVDGWEEREGRGRERGWEWLLQVQVQTVMFRLPSVPNIKTLILHYF